ncbi:bifunctional helix-turn-helix transcriptional regulator/GNAT family N-acetyltransferase [Aurantimonas sp. MSK8Z-1]|uniref:bifunctional helix-turn-helix transcriptional regulator/GNAT family N-acetyltransferase n=1 Tax=Mangrovibrevibacter kandeliae TaxID=2968473 RepID=UPI002118D034|nr:bifunctional helix-turn-helix transcriptional regulator/GNAT family N-acetyltransferase [Aurantimonas sp. MSK8Z-1]MCW4116581.1 bifunctional helix-turn-helix transcriptional regulator/GNAT family N-acetyltransferase [Aurantimonas sp. MSK8Z-1]
MSLVDEVRSFNRFYTRAIGLLERHLPASDLSLPEARVVYEIAQRRCTAAEIGRLLDMDKAHLSRIVGRLRARGLVASKVSPEHGRHLLLSLTPTGTAAFAAMEDGTREAIAALLRDVDAGSRQRLGAALRDIRAAFGEAGNSAPPVLRPLGVGDVGWIIHRQARLYHEDYGWDWTYEALVARILADYVAGFDPAREDGWIAERDGRILGSVFLMKSEEPQTGRLRLLYVEPEARGLGLGHRLVETCIDRARALGYRRLTLWTNDILLAARRIYQAKGFRLVDEAPHHSFGHDLVGQTWILDL